MAEHAVSELTGLPRCCFLGGVGRIEFPLANGQVAAITCDVLGVATSDAPLGIPDEPVETVFSDDSAIAETPATTDETEQAVLDSSRED